jgi:hypothetical protein
VKTGREQLSHSGDARHLGVDFREFSLREHAPASRRRCCRREARKKSSGFRYRKSSISRQQDYPKPAKGRWAVSPLIAHANRL